MPGLAHRLAGFAAHAAALSGAGEADARAFCERLLRAFGWRSLRHAGAVFAASTTHGEFDLIVSSTLWLALKPRGTDLAEHRQRAFEHWHDRTAHPRYVVLCNYSDLVIHDFNRQIWEPLDHLPLASLPREHPALGFLLPDPRPPVFRNDRVAVTRDAVDRLAAVFHRLVQRGAPRELARRFLLRRAFDLFAAAVDPAPRRSPLFPDLESFALTVDEQSHLDAAAARDWSRVELPVFGALFQRSMDRERRHAQGAHFTSEADIQRIVLPTLVRPWRQQIAAAATSERLLAVHHDLARLRVLDPACGSGNFLYVAYRELLRLELELVARLRPESAPSSVFSPRVSIRNFFGLDTDPFAVELARVTLQLATRFALRELRPAFPVEPEPLSELHDNLRHADALFTDWPAVDVILGNPPFQSKNKIQRELGPDYVRRLRRAFPEVSGLADYCVYWFRKAHDHLPIGGRAGLVGTNTIRQNSSRDSGLGHIVASGTITDAVASEVWSGDAAVHVSIVNWTRHPCAPGKKSLSWQTGDAAHSPWQTVEVERIGPSLSPHTDVSAARVLRANAGAGRCYQGQTVGHEAFLLPPASARAMLRRARGNAAVILPFLIGDDLLGRADGSPSRWVIDFGDRDLHEAREFTAPFARIRAHVLPDREAAAAEELRRNADLLRADARARVNRHHANFREQWWRLSWRRGEMLAAIAPLSRFAACVRVTKRPIFEFVSPQIRPSDALVVFAFDDDYSFGLLQSSVHWQWFTARCSTLKRDHRYTSSTVFDAFPWPQRPSAAQVVQVARAARHLRTVRTRALQQLGCSRRQLYRDLDTPRGGPLRRAHDALDRAVRAAYGMPGGAAPLRFLLDLNHELAAREAAGAAIVGPGLAALAPGARLRAACRSRDCIEPA
ncbi:DNA methyltransferase [Nannocystis pusilla]|uniref:site-specific DNA-methyltransferase (adenine-specific) n=1 Tax=Nannocystis pusilla TaxID=889268 RepID=A0ABS7U2F1_9BACT|nr:DNA methyltransferase [Nannocystis pusilla]MBZ5714704.1 N-6 DNA methylase [Nannocystis pusilla]